MLHLKFFIFVISLLLFCPTSLWKNVFQSISNVDILNHYQTVPIILFYRSILNTKMYVKNVNNYNSSNTCVIKNILQKIPFTNARFYEVYKKFINKCTNDCRSKASINEALKVYNKALQLRSLNFTTKAKKLIIHALKLYPTNPDILAEYGEIIEVHDTNIILAEFYCTKAVIVSPLHSKAEACRRRTSPIVEELDQWRLNQIDVKVFQFFKIPESHPKLKEVKKDQYFSYIFHTVAIEGNTLSLFQTRSILETRLAIGGKSIIEQNEVLGIDMALKYINSLLNKVNNQILIKDILEIHKRVLGFVDISEAGQFRKKQVFIADHTPPDHADVPQLMNDLIYWLNNQEDVHPIELAALVHWKFVFIHPFQDGNGRTARLLMNFILMRNRYPPSVIKIEDRKLYFKLIKLANEGDVRPFIRFIADCTERTIDEYLSSKIPESIESFPYPVTNKNLTIFYSDYQ